MARDEEIEIVDTLDDGSWVTSDGEVMTVPAGAEGGRLGFAVAQMRYAREQIKAWTQEAIRWQAVILHEQAERMAVYGDTVASKRRNPITAFNPIPLAEKGAIAISFQHELDETVCENIRENIRDLLACSTGWSVDRLNDLGYGGLAPLAERTPTGAYTREWVDVRAVRRDYSDRRKAAAS